MVIPDQSPRICAFSFLSTLFHLLWKHSVLSHGGRDLPKKGTHGPGQPGTLVILGFTCKFSLTSVFLLMTFTNDEYL